MDNRLTETDLAKRWKISTRTLQKWRKAGKGPAFLDIGNNTIRYREEDVLAYEKRSLQGGDRVSA